MPEHHRSDDGYIPSQVKWIMTFINRIGFPIAVCIYFAWQQNTQGKKTIEAINDFKEVVSTLNRNIELQTKILRHKANRDD
jgi:hypothetical protein